MKRRYVALTVFLLSSAVFGAVWRPESLVPSEAVLAVEAKITDAESVLAAGEKIALIEADMFSLELVPGLSDVLASAILRKRREITARASFLAPENRQTALELVHGIGKARAKDLNHYLELTSRIAGERRSPYEGLAIRNEKLIQESLLGNVPK